MIITGLTPRGELLCDFVLLLPVGKKTSMAEVGAPPEMFRGEKTYLLELLDLGLLKHGEDIGAGLLSSLSLI